MKSGTSGFALFAFGNFGVRLSRVGISGELLYFYLMDYYPPLYPDSYYHIYNRGNNGDNLFYKKENYFHFLKKFNHYLDHYLDTFAYCLLPNHFHLLVRIKDFKEFKSGLRKG